MIEKRIISIIAANVVPITPLYHSGQIGSVIRFCIYPKELFLEIISENVELVGILTMTEKNPSHIVPTITTKIAILDFDKERIKSLNR